MVLDFLNVWLWWVGKNKATLQDKLILYLRFNVKFKKVLDGSIKGVILLSFSCSLIKATWFNLWRTGGLGTVYDLYISTIFYFFLAKCYNVDFGKIFEI